MTVRLLIPILVLINLTASYSQAIPAYGVVTVEELKMKQHPLDSSAEAIILFDIGKVTVRSNNTWFERHIRIKLFKKSAFHKWGQMKFEVENESVLTLKAVSHNLAGNTIQSTEIPENAFLRKKIVRGVDEISFAFPNLAEGSIVELSFAEKSFGFVLPFWKFQSTVPTLYSEYSINDLYNNFKYDYHLTGTLQPTEQEKSVDGKFQRWMFKNVPSFKTEVLMPDIDLYRAGIVLYVKGDTWMTVHKRYTLSPSSIGVIQDNYVIRKTKELIAGQTNPKEKIKIISDFVKKEVKWNGGQDIYAYDPETVLRKKEGSSGDINLLLASMLDKAGFTVNLVLLSTRDHGVVMYDFPSLRQFNYVVCHVEVEGTIFLLDATEEFLPYDLLPERCSNHKGFFVGREEFGWIAIEPKVPEKISIQAELELSSYGQIQGIVKQTNQGYAAFEARSIANTKGEDDLRKYLLNHHEWDVSDLKVTNIKENILQPVLLEYKIQMRDDSNQSGERIYFNPFLFMKQESNPFLSDERIYPVDFSGLVEKNIILNILIPEGYVIEESPASKVIAIPENGAKFTFHVTQSGQRLLITTRLQINKTLFMPEEYLQLKEFYTRVIAKKNEVFVLKKST